MWQGALDVAAGRLSGGAIAAFVLTGGLVAGAFGALTETYGDLLRAAGAAGRLGELLAEEPGIAAPANPLPIPDTTHGQLSFDRVTFRYPTRPERSEEHTSELQSLMRISYAVFCLKKKTQTHISKTTPKNNTTTI